MKDYQAKAISADRPISLPPEDKLGRGVFAGGIARAITNWDGEESLVIGLYGEWGSGKTSIKNLIVGKLGNEALTDSPVLEFNPWMWSGQEKLTTAFFSELGKVLGREGSSEDAERRVAKLSAYAKYATLGHGTIKALSKLATNSGVPFLPILAMLLESSTEQVAEALKHGAEGADAQAKASKRTLGEVKAELALELK